MDRAGAGERRTRPLDPPRRRDRADKATGRLVTTFDENPQLPVSDIKLTFKDGATAPLATPQTCGQKAIGTRLDSWGGQTAERSSTFTVDCAAGLGRFSPSFEAGAVTPTAGASSPLVIAGLALLPGRIADRHRRHRRGSGLRALPRPRLGLPRRSI